MALAQDDMEQITVHRREAMNLDEVLQEVESRDAGGVRVAAKSGVSPHGARFSVIPRFAGCPCPPSTRIVKSRGTIYGCLGRCALDG